MRNPSLVNFNFFKVNANVLNTQINEFIKNSFDTNKELLQNLENEFKLDFYKIKSKEEDPQFA